MITLEKKENWTFRLICWGVFSLEIIVGKQVNQRRRIKIVTNYQYIEENFCSFPGRREKNDHNKKTFTRYYY